MVSGTVYIGAYLTWIFQGDKQAEAVRFGAVVRFGYQSISRSGSLLIIRPAAGTDNGIGFLCLRHERFPFGSIGIALRQLTVSVHAVSYGQGKGIAHLEADTAVRRDFAGYQNFPAVFGQSA